jgi:hypothetical protein
MPKGVSVKFKISDMCLAVVAAAIGTKIALGSDPADDLLDASPVYGLLLGALIFCPLTLLKQLALERRATSLRLGECLWLASFTWAFAVFVSVCCRTEELVLALALPLGLVLHPILSILGVVCIVRWCAKDSKPLLWSEVLGCVITMVFAAWYLLLLYLHPPIF